MQKSFRVGTSGWNYPHWRNRFYPPGLAAKDWLDWYARHFDTVEINNTFYQLPQAKVFGAWRKAAPPRFLFAVKCNRYVTHNLKLGRARQPLKLFFSRVARLQARGGPILYQLPPRWHKNVPRLREFCAQLPRRRTHVMEFRNAEWLAEDVYEVLGEFGVSLCVHDLLPDHPKLILGKAAYVRLHGTKARYAGGYSRDQLRRWAEWMREAADQVKVVFAYFNNDVEGDAVRNAQTLCELLA